MLLLMLFTMILSIVIARFIFVVRLIADAIDIAFTATVEGRWRWGRWGAVKVTAQVTR